MTTELVPVENFAIEKRESRTPTILVDEGLAACERARDFFAVKQRNKNTRAAYLHSVFRFLEQAQAAGLHLKDIEPIHVAAYVEKLQEEFSVSTIKQHVSAIKEFFDYLITGHIVRFNPVVGVSPPKQVIRKGKTPVLSAEDMGKLIRSIDLDTITGLRDRALIALMGYTFARVGAVVAMNVEDYYPNGKRFYVRLHEKGGVYNEVPVHIKAEEYLDAYIEAAGLQDLKKVPLFRTCRGRSNTLLENRMNRTDVLRMVYRRAKNAGINTRVCCHTFRGTGITTYLQNGGNLETAQAIAGHATPRTTKLYDRRSDEIDYEEISRIHF